MRTTLTIDDKLAKALKDAAHRSGKSFKEIVNESLRAGLSARSSRKPRPYRLKPAALGDVRPGIDLDRALRLADQLEDEEIVRELRLQK